MEKDKPFKSLLNNQKYSDSTLDYNIETRDGKQGIFGLSRIFLYKEVSNNKTN